MNNYWILISVEIFEKRILSFGEIPKIIEFLWDYDISSYGDSATLCCYGYFKNENNILEKKYIGYVTFIPNNIKDYYKKVNDLAVEICDFATKEYNAKIYFPSQGKIEFDFQSYEELYLINHKHSSQNENYEKNINSLDSNLNKNTSEENKVNLRDNKKKNFTIS
ncbi:MULTISPECIES: hypothetical protein [Empedobacter]|uniref:Uncharacterized protein n=1 Tax=Empedobacter falsenii TaxID=343874 RepID=A0A7H9DTH2_9FLAO|nr:MULTISPECIES: hypothetical protein [Empedobacter]MDH2208726.1 hypothetical protein [Empedobacter sp. GD03644]QLL58021.1 hypothetical protein FH779_07985 [Empedobacter falsenii]